jgi:hypothetical protein
MLHRDTTFTNNLGETGAVTVRGSSVAIFKG